MPRYRAREFQCGEWWIERRGDSPAYYRASYDKKARRVRRFSLETTDFEQAKLKLLDWYTLNHRPRDAKPEAVEIVTILLQYYEDHGKYAVDPSRIRLAISHAADHFKGEVVADLTRSRQTAYGRAREALGVSEGTWGRELSVVRAALRLAHLEGVISSVPAFITLPKGGNRDRVLSQDEFGALLEASEPHCRAAILVMAHTCCRPTAALDLTVFQCDKDRRLVDLNPPGRRQTKKRRPIVPMTGGFLRLLEETEGTHLVEWRGRRVQSIKRAFGRARGRAGLSPDVIPYAIRHTMATAMTERAVPDSEVRGMLGHVMPGVTGAYVHHRPDYLSAAASLSMNG